LNQQCLKGTFTASVLHICTTAQGARLGVCAGKKCWRIAAGGRVSSACLQRVGTSAQIFRGQEVSATRAVNRLGRAAVRRCSSAVHGGVCCVSAKPVQCSTACSPRMHARGHVAVLRQPQAVPAVNHVTPMSGCAHVCMRPPYTAELGHRAKVSARPSTLL